MEKLDNINTPNDSAMGQEEPSPPADLKKYTDMQEMFQDYEKLANEAATILICNHSSLNMAIEMGFSDANKGQVAHSEFEDQEKL